MNIKITAVSPISHGAFSDGADTGNVSDFRRISVLSDGSVKRIPAISGNAIRGVLRRILGRELFDRAEFGDMLTAAQHDRLYSVIANGGTLSKELDVTVDTDYLRELRVKAPVLSLFGSACYHYMLKSMCNVGFAVLDCVENGKGDKKIADLLDEIGETKHVDREQADSKNTDMKPMPYTIETVIPGATFSCGVDFLPQATPTEKSAFAHGLNLLKTIGGKSNRGYGKIEIAADEDISESMYLKYLLDIDKEFLAEFARGL